MTTTGTSPDIGGTEARELSAGLIGAGIAVCAWSTGTVLAKGIEMGGLAIGTYRFWLFSLVLILWIRLSGSPFNLHSMRATAFGGIALGADIALFFSAVKNTSIVNATIIGSLQPILVGVVAARFFGEKIRGRDAIWSLVALAGVFVIVTTSTSDDVNNIKGDLLALGAMLSWSAYFIASKQSKGKVTPTEFTAGTALWTAIIVTPLGFAFGQDMSWPSWKNWALLAAMAIGSGLIGHVADELVARTDPALGRLDVHPADPGLLGDHRLDLPRRGDRAPSGTGNGSRDRRARRDRPGPIERRQVGRSTPRRCSIRSTPTGRDDVAVSGVEALGYLASALVILSLTMRSVVRLRLISLCGSVAFFVVRAVDRIAPGDGHERLHRRDQPVVPPSGVLRRRRETQRPRRVHHPPRLTVPHRLRRVPRRRHRPLPARLPHAAGRRRDEPAPHP